MTVRIFVILETGMIITILPLIIVVKNNFGFILPKLLLTKEGWMDVLLKAFIFSNALS